VQCFAKYLFLVEGKFLNLVCAGAVDGVVMVLFSGAAARVGAVDCDGDYAGADAGAGGKSLRKILLMLVLAPASWF
jgi:hypothetical protein